MGPTFTGVIHVNTIYVILIHGCRTGINYTRCNHNYNTISCNMKLGPITITLAYTRLQL